MELRFIKWTPREDDALRRAFHISKSNYKGSHGDAGEEMRIFLLNQGIIRSKQGVLIVLKRLGLTFFSLTDEIYLNCLICGKQFKAYKRLINRNKCKVTLCPEHQKQSLREWDIRNHDKKIKYYREYYRSFKK